MCVYVDHIGGASAFVCMERALFNDGDTPDILAKDIIGFAVCEHKMCAHIYIIHWSLLISNGLLGNYAKCG